MMLGAALLAVGAVLGISRLGEDEAPAAASATPAAPAEAPKAGDAAGVAAEAEPLYIVKDETRYELVRGRERALGVRLVVENMPDRYEVKLGGAPASVDDDQRLPGGGNRREVFATVNFASEIERMRKNPDEQLRLPVEVTDLEAAGNAGSIAIYIDPRRLRLDDKGGTPAAGPVKVERAESPDPAPPRKAARKRRDVTPVRAAAGKRQADGPQQTQDEVRYPPPKGGGQQPAAEPAPSSKMKGAPATKGTREPCTTLRKAVGKC